VFAGVRGLGLWGDRMSRDELHVARIDKAAAQGLHADLWDPIWRAAPPLYVHTNQGTNLDGGGASLVEIRAVRDDDTIYFAFTWDDPTRSFKHAPLVKSEDGWHAMFAETKEAHVETVAGKSNVAKDTLNNYEDAIAEDKFAIMLANVEKPFGPGAFHPGARPVADKPASFSGRGQHYTEDGSRVNLWLWHANGADSGRCENNRVGPPLKPTAAQLRGAALYKGGYVGENAEAVDYENFTPALPRDSAALVQPIRLPTNLAATSAALGHVDLDPDHGDADDSRWSLRENESAPYTPERDAAIPVGATIPGLVATQRPILPTDVRCTAHWTAGRWTLLAERKLDTHHGDDIPVSGATYLWVGVFDHTVANHTRHIRPFKLEMNP